MVWFKKKDKRPRGPDTPQARALNWRIFLEEAEPALRAIGIPAAAWATQETFVEFMETGAVSPGERWVPRPEDRDRFRDLVWLYRDRMKLRFGASFIEMNEEASRLTEQQILRELRKSELWGTNEQPEDVQALARALAMLPLYRVQMKTATNLSLRFLRPLTDSESRMLAAAAGVVGEEEDIFVAGQPKLEASVWWD